MKKAPGAFNYSIAVHIILIAVLLVGCSPHFNQAKIDATIKKQLTEAVIEMDKKDQQYRWQIMFGEPDIRKVDSLSKLPGDLIKNHIKKPGSADYNLTQREYDSIVMLQTNSDRIIQERILKIDKQYGWPGKNLVGPKGAGIVAITMLHFPDSLKRALYPKLKKEYKQGNIEGANVARMYDKYLLSMQKPLLYGMFDHYDAANKVTLSPLIEDIKSTNKARKELGLAPLTKYRINKSN